MSAEQHGRSPSGPEPACSRTSGNWNEETVTGGLLAFHEPCSLPDCYPDDEAPEEGDTVLRARGTAGNKLHRPAVEDEQEEADEPGHASAVAEQLRLAEKNGTLPDNGGDQA